MDSYKKSMAIEWVEQLDWIINQVAECDDGDLTSVMDMLAEAKDEIESLM